MNEVIVSALKIYVLCTIIDQVFQPATEIPDLNLNTSGA